MLVNEYQFEVMWSTQQRKHKTWRDGKLKYNSFSKKIVLLDEAGHVVVAGWSPRVPAAGAELEIENASVQVSSLLSWSESEHVARKPDAAVREMPKRQLPRGGLSLDDIILRSKIKRPRPPRSSSPESVSMTADMDDSGSESDVPVILKVAAVDPPKGGPVDFPDCLPSEGPWTKEAYLLTSWRPPVIKQEPM